MSTIRGWWEEDRQLIQRFFNTELGRAGQRSPRECEDHALSQAVVRQHLASPAVWSIFQLQDLLGMDPQLRRADVPAERINQPDNPKHYWRYRMHLTLGAACARPGSFNAHIERHDPPKRDDECPLCVLHVGDIVIPLGGSLLLGRSWCAIQARSDGCRRWRSESAGVGNKPERTSRPLPRWFFVNRIRPFDVAFGVTVGINQTPRFRP